MRTIRFALVAVAALALAGCSSWNPLVFLGFKTEPANKPKPLAAINAQVAPRAIWTAHAGKSLGASFRPVSQGGNVYAAAGDGTISVFNEDTGRVVSKFDTKKRLSAGLEVGDGKIIAGTAGGEVIAYDTSGKSLWASPVAGEVIAPAAIASKVAVVRTTDGRILGLAAEIDCDVGAYSAFPFTCAVEPLMASTELPGVYKVPAYRARGRAIATNKAPAAPYRGVSRPQIVLVMEQLMERAARALGMDPIELRRVNMISPGEFPYM
ncbi:MAG TPA: molybdopterin cofactor-binding domain-containing protein, partial [Usitatibacter sp.]